MIVKLAFFIVVLLCLSECKPVRKYGPVSPEDYEEMDKFSREIIDYLNEMTQTIESYLNPIYDMFSVLERRDSKEAKYWDSYAFEFEYPERAREDNEVAGEIYGHDYDFPTEVSAASVDYDTDD